MRRLDTIENALNVSAPDPACDTLFLPFANNALTWPTTGRALFLRARLGAAWRSTRYASSLVCEQSFKPDADRLEQAGLHLDADADERFPLVLILPPRQRDEARALFAQALRRVTPGGVVVASVPNNLGARSAETDLERIAGPVTNLSKNKCRVFWVTADANSIDAAVFEEWSALDAPRPIADGLFSSRPGLFHWDAIDPASRLLAEHLPSDLAGRAADLGAGYGYLSARLIEKNPQIIAVDLYEAEARALELARTNLCAESARVELGFHWHDVRRGLLARYDVVVSNPPFHQGRADAPGLGQAFIHAAAAALRPGGQLWLVANRHLPYETALTRLFLQVQTVAVGEGFKVIQASKATDTP